MFRRHRIRDRHPIPPPPSLELRRHGSILQKLAIGLASTVGGSALITYEMTQTARQAHPPRGRFRRIAGAQINYIDEGQGPAVVLIHGNGTLWDDWMLSGVVQQLAQSHRVIALSRPGFGYSVRPRGVAWTASRQGSVVTGLMDALGIERAVVVGHSWGTLVATAMALDRPERVSGLVLLSGYFYPTARADVPMLSPPAIPVVGDVLRYTFGPIVGAMLFPFMAAKAFLPKPVPELFLQRFPASLALTPTQLKAVGEDTALMIEEARRLSPRYPALRVPAVVMWGEQDAISTPSRQSQRFVSETGAKGYALAGVGHMVQWARPDEVRRLVDDVERQRVTAPATSGRERATGSSATAARV